MPDALFDDPRLARVYDAFDGSRDDLDPYLRLVGDLGARLVVDVGCGTGSFALLAAAAGFAVTAVDPALASLDVARSKPGSEMVTWLHGDATSLPDLQADVAVMTGNVAQVFLTDESWAITLAAVRRALRPGGHFVFETRDPNRRIWEQWASDPAEARADVPGVGSVSQHRELTSVELPYVSFRWAHTFADGDVVTSDSTLRFRTEEEIRTSLATAHLQLLEIRDAPDRAGLEQVFVARRDS